MLKNKRILLIIILIIAILLIPNLVKADEETKTTTTTINGITVNWSYKLDENSKVKDLKCTNVDAISGKFSIPDKIDEKDVVSIGNEAFKGAKEIEEITIPSTVKEIGLWAFSGCTKLAKVDLGNVEKISDQSFKDCTSLTNIIIPKTLKENASGAPFTGCTNLKKIELEEEMTIIPNYICASTPITEITIPTTVKEIGLWAFSGCTKLAKVDLGNVEKISDKAFKDCTSLTSITIPKTLKENASGAPFTGCTNLKKIELEEGMTVIPNYICASTPITEITIPSTVKEIGMWAFNSCKELKKITILDNVVKIGSEAFKDHNEDLTIYCYKDSTAAKYAIENDIKYVYLTKTPSEESTKRYISFPFVIYNGKSSLSIKNYEGEYTLYYQFVEITDETMEKVEELKNQYKEGKISYSEFLAKYDEIVTKYDDKNWIETKDGNFEADLSKFTGTKKFVLWAKLVMKDETVYESEIYTMNGSGSATNVPDEQDKTDTKDTTTAKTTLPKTGRILFIWVALILVSSAIIANVRYRRLYK